MCYLQMQKRDIDIPEFLNIEVSELTDYPPKFSIHMHQTSDHAHQTSDELGCESPKLLVQGLDIDCSFQLVTSSKLY